jgi:DNA-binding NarL/FixJ family response regulator
MVTARPKVLIVDDSEICRDTAKLMLGEMGFDVIALASPIGFNMRLMSHRPDIALVDIGMPTLQGNHLVDIAHKHGTVEICPIVLFSGRPESELERVAQMCGADGYISKDSDWKTIGQQIDGMIRKPRH